VEWKQWALDKGKIVNLERKCHSIAANSPAVWGNEVRIREGGDMQGNQDKNSRVDLGTKLETVWDKFG
jgi:hypothetical protein